MLQIIDDGLHEHEETLRLVLGSPVSLPAGGAAIGAHNYTVIKINDHGDSEYSFVTIYQFTSMALKPLKTSYDSLNYSNLYTLLIIRW